MIAAAWFLLGVVVGIAFLAVCIAWDRQTVAPTPARTRPTSSNRKAGRSS